MKDVLFISHATPSDNEFSIWLASRLEMLGYKIWIDKEGLLGGERFWATIQKAIDSSIKVLLVYSQNIVTSDGIIRSGIENEIEYAKSIASQNKYKDFIIPLHIDNTQYNLVIGLPNINHIPFNDNWAAGLKQLLKKLEQDSVPRNFDSKQSSFAEWYENEYVSNCVILPRKELYYTSWWTIADCPETFYMYQFANAKQAQTIRELNKNIPISIISNVISSFESHLNYFIASDGESIQVLPEHTYTFTSSDVLSGFDSETFPMFRDVENHYKRLLLCSVYNIFRAKGLRRNNLSNKRFAFFLPKYDCIKRVDFIYPFSKHKKSKSIIGKYKDIGMWHYAVSLKPSITPHVGFLVKSHILFTTDGFRIIEDDKKVHRYRRDKGKQLFNDKWRDLFLAYIQRLKDNECEIKIDATLDGKKFKMKEWPEFLWSEVGYTDPNSEMDINKVEDYYSETIEDQ